MAPRRSTAAPSAVTQGASLASLPDALLERILGLLEQEDRQAGQGKRALLVRRRRRRCGCGCCRHLKQVGGA